MLVHDRGYIIAAAPGGDVTFCRPDGTALPPSPPLPASAGIIENCHDADITPGTIIPAWHGEQLNLDYAIHASFANAEYHARQRDRDQRDQAYREKHPETVSPAADLATPEPEPWPPSMTGVNVLTAMQNQAQKYAR